MKNQKLPIYLNEQTTHFTQFRDNLLQKQLSESDNKSISIQMKSINQNSSRTQSITVSPSISNSQARKNTILKYLPKYNLGESQQQQINPLSNNSLNIQSGETSVQNNYDIWDLTYTLMSSQIPIVITAVFFFIFVLIRYYTFACLIYIATQMPNSQDTLWTLIILADRFLYMLLVIKISLQTPQTRTEIVLKSHWNSTQSQISQYFQIIDNKKLLTSIIRGLIPAELSFLYIRAVPRRRFELYAAINYINASIEAILYYPFFIIYCSILTVDNTFSINKYYPGATIALAVLAQLIMVLVTIILIFIGIKRKYGKLLYWI